MLLFILNEKAGHGQGAHHWQQMKQRLQEKQITYKIIRSHSEQETQQQITQITRTYSIKTICIIGGDGTIHSVLQALVHLTIPIAIFPTGSGNDTARMFQLTQDPHQFIEQIQTDNTIDIDIFQANNRFGITIAGVGIDSMIGQTVNASSYKLLLNKMKLGPLSYIIALFQVAISFKAFHTTLTIDGVTEDFKKTWVVACGNTSSYGGGLQICPQADPTDGQLNITIFHHFPKLKAMLRIFPTLLQKKPRTTAGITYRTGHDIKIQTSRPIDVVVDGEIIAQTPLHIQLHKHALRLLITT